MQTRREYAASLGLAIAGARGKFSNDAKVAIAKAEASGMRFSDTVAPKTVDPTGPVAYTKAETKEVGDYRSSSEYRFPEQSYKALDGAGKEVSMRAACQTRHCGYSLVDHRCDTPVTVDGPVTIVKR